MSAGDDQIDRLYQLPLSDFTAARDALAKAAGREGAAIKQLQKPNAAAWAVNQLYWRRRRTFDRLVTAAERRRTAHAARLSGKPADVAAAEAAHQAALNAAVDESRDLLLEAGDAGSPATLTAVSETLQTLPWEEPPGRLTRPQKPIGFEALADLMKGRPLKATARALVVPIRPALKPADRAKAEAESRHAEAANVERQLRTARAAQEKADAVVGRARQTLEHAVRDRERLEVALEKATTQTQQLRENLNLAMKRAKDAAADHARLRDRLDELRRGS